MIKLFSGLLLALSCLTATAATYNVSTIFNGSDGGFSFSSLHDASGSNPQALGPDGILANVLLTGFSGTYNDVTGSFNAVLALDNAAGPMSLSGILLFDGAGLLAANSTLDLTFSGTQGGALSDTIIGFEKGKVCCSGTNYPNTFDGNIMTLWGANFDSSADFINTGSYAGATLGLDFRIALTPVPVPAAVWLFGSGLLGLVGIARRKV
ncbi:hypothetical protein MNBD_GAMMA06-309 [hydrothermal vent metagenome]|uniref:PEP-CTERM protein-sorting domain-containing protein n=1 Tax=hydrothermal vent metagenome TaxID=652676 RepID=A0A3B0WJP9_9ZZZZ